MVTLNIGEALAYLQKVAEERPGRVYTAFFTVFVVACVVALAFPSSRLPFAVTAVVALGAAIAVGSVAASRADSDEVEPDGEAPDPTATPRERPEHRRHRESLNNRNAAIHRSWMRGDFADPDLARKHRDDTLEGMLAIRANQLQDRGLRGASIVVLRHEADEFLVRDVGGALKGHLSRGDHCPADRDLEDALRDHAPYSRHVRRSCCGRQVIVAVTADVPIGEAAEDKLEDIADLYQVQYERLQLFRRTAELQAASLAGPDKRMPTA